MKNSDVNAFNATKYDKEPILLNLRVAYTNLQEEIEKFRGIKMISLFWLIGNWISYKLKTIAQKNCYAIFHVDKSLRFFENLNLYS